MYPGSYVLGQDFFGPPRPGQTYEAFQEQMSPLVPVGAALMLVNPLVGAAVVLGGLLTPTRTKPGKTHGWG